MGSERFVRRRSLVLVVAAKLHKTNRQIAGKPVNAMEKIQSSRSYYYVPERERDEEHEGGKRYMSVKCSFMVDKSISLGIETLTHHRYFDKERPLDDRGYR